MKIRFLVEIIDVPLLREHEIVKIVAAHLESRCFTVKTNPGHKRGVDIKAITTRGELHFIEAEGNAKPSGERLTSTQMYTHYYRAIGQICMRMTENEGRGDYALALPDDLYYKKKVKETIFGLKKLGIGIYWVTENGKIQYN